MNPLLFVPTNLPPNGRSISAIIGEGWRCSPLTWAMSTAVEGREHRRRAMALVVVGLPRGSCLLPSQRNTE
jgi:hypothetical protein